jgi:hypothetical protein
MKEYFTRLKQKMKYNSFWRLVHDGLVRIGIKITPYYLVEEGGGPDLPEFERDRYPGYSVGYLGRDEMKLIAGLEREFFTEERLKERCDKEMRCLAVKKEGKIHAFTWFNLKECDYAGHRFTLNEHEAYLQDAYVFMQYRGLRLAPFIRYQAYKELRKLGRIRFYSITEAFNEQSIKFKKKLNARFDYLGLYIRLFNKWHISFPLRRS